MHTPEMPIVLFRLRMMINTIGWLADIHGFLKKNIKVVKQFSKNQAERTTVNPPEACVALLTTTNKQKQHMPVRKMHQRFISLSLLVPVSAAGGGSGLVFLTGTTEEQSVCHFQVLRDFIMACYACTASSG